MIRNYILSIISIFIIILSSIFIYTYVNMTENSIKNYSVSYFINNAVSLSQNIITYINKNYSSDLFQYLLKHKLKIEELNEYLSSFITKNNKNIFIVYKDKKGFYRVIADGVKDKNERFDFNERFIPLKKDKWKKIFETKHFLIYYSKIKNIWVTLLYPYIEKNKIKYFLVYDFSVLPVKWISKNIELIKNTLKYFLFVVVIILIILLYFIFYDAKIQKRLKNYNKELETEVKNKLEELREKDKKMLLQSRLALMGEMLSMIAHQWRQPLNSISSIIGNIQIDIELDSLDEVELNKKLDEINKIIQYLSDTIETFSKFYRKDSKKRKINLDNLLEETLKIINPSIRNKNISIKKEINCKEKIEIYPNYLKQVLLNIIKNAIDALKEKNIQNPTINIKIFQKENKCIIEIEDNAGGINEKIKNKIFEPYFTTKDEKNGTGLGLYMSKVLVENYLNGKLIQYNSRNGAVFRIELKV